jgi:DNA ligase-1
VYLALNQVFPAYEGLELGIGDALLVKAVVEATGRTKQAVEAAYKNVGDLGIVALESRSKQATLGFSAKPKPLTARLVLEELRTITRTTGGKSTDRKVGIIKKMMISCQGMEAKYLVRALQGKLRIGLAAQTVLSSLAQAFVHSMTSLSFYEASDPSGEDATAAKETDKETEEETKDAPAAKRRRVIADDSESDTEEKSSIKAAAAAPAAAPAPAPAAVAVAASTEGEGEAPAEAVSPALLLEAVSKGNEPDEARKLRLAVHAMKNKKSSTYEHSKTPVEQCELGVIAVKRAFSECPNSSSIVAALLSAPIYELHKRCLLTPGIPVAPMLAKPSKQVADVLKRLEGQLFTMEYKYDGERAQVHLVDDDASTVKIFSRNSEDNSLKYPDLMDIVRTAKHPDVRSFVVDAEVVAYDRDKKCLLPFQILSTRKRKVEDGEEDNQKVKIILQVFDILYLNGQSLLPQSLQTRREILRSSFVHTEGLLHFAIGADHREDGDTAPIEAFMQEACVAQCEGLMVKTLLDNATYDPSKRSLNWLKLKKDYINGMGVCDSVDLVVLGGYYGRGKRTNVYGAYLMACYDSENDEFQSVCKVGTGFKDEDLTRLTESMKEFIVESHRKPNNYIVEDSLAPDDWFRPHAVWELQAADLSKSSTHKGAIGKLEPGRGIGLR